MRFAAPLLLWFALAAPAAAQDCEASVSGKAGEVSAGLRGDGAMLVSWSVERREGVGEESDHFSRPGLLLEFNVADADAPMVPRMAMAPITRYSDPDIGRAPPLAQVRVRVVASGAAPIEWRGDDPAKGEAALVKRLKDAWPDELVIEVVGTGDRVLASSTFDLSMRADAEMLARQAAAKAAEKCR